MTASGQNAKYSARADVFRFAPKTGHRSMRSVCPVCAKSRLMRRSSALVLESSSTNFENPLDLDSKIEGQRRDPDRKPRVTAGFTEDFDQKLGSPV